MKDSSTITSSYKFINNGLRLISADIVSPTPQSKLINIVQGNTVKFRVVISSDIKSLYMQKEGNTPIEEIMFPEKEEDGDKTIWTFSKEFTGAGNRTIKFFGEDNDLRRTNVENLRQQLTVGIDPGKWQINYDQLSGNIDIKQTGGLEWNKDNTYKLYIRDLSANKELLLDNRTSLFVPESDSNPELYNRTWSSKSDLGLIDGRKYEIGISGTSFRGIVPEVKLIRTIAISNVKIYSMTVNKQSVKSSDVLNFEVTASNDVTRLDLYIDGKLLRSLKGIGIKKIQFRPFVGATAYPMDTKFLKITIK